MRRLNSKGELNLLLVPLVLVSIVLLVAIILAANFHSKEQNYRDNTDKIVATAVAANTKKVQAEAAGHYAIVAKNPLRTYQGPSDFGSIVIKYPKTWSLYVDKSGDSDTPIDGYGYPQTVPGTDSDDETAYALRFQLSGTSYDQVVSGYQDQVQSGDLTVEPYKPANIKGVIGVRVQGKLDDNSGKSVDMIVLPLRNQTFELWTESADFETDFSKYILPNFSFSP